MKRGSDWFGASVNVAARVTAAAAGDEVLLTRATLEAAGDVEGVELDSRGEIHFRNVAEPVQLYRALLVGDRRGDLPIDPVCRMAIAPGHATGWLVHGGRQYWLCSMLCVATFAANAEAIIKQSPQRSEEGGSETRDADNADGMGS